jgi:hypothetical protein
MIGTTIEIAAPDITGIIARIRPNPDSNSSI